ncbi:hypothetical protein [Thalassotalea litorea]|uniref:hypothetical protein n=1 Tax=Thalassotalea litorea TaxID=2020715 RepID=UPI003735EC99
MKKILAVASDGGHWIQLNRLAPIFNKNNTTFVSTFPKNGDENHYCVTDANLDEKFKLIIQAFQILFIVIRIRPDVVISTGASPGFFAILFAKIFNKKTVWLDSIANSEELSLSGQKIGGIVGLWLTQWPELADKNGPKYKGKVL